MDKKLSVEEIIRNFEAEKAKNLDTVPETKKEETNEGELSENIENIYSEMSTNVTDPNVIVLDGDEESETDIKPSDVTRVYTSSESDESPDKEHLRRSKADFYERNIITFKIFKNEETDKKKVFETGKKKHDDDDESGSTLVKHHRRNLTLNNINYIDFHLLKIIVVGDYSVGKTAIIQRYTKNTFSTKYQVTIGTEFSLKELRWDLSTILKVHFWDIAGQERTGAVTRQFYKSSHGIILVCDASRSKTYSGLVKWIGNLKQYVLQFDGTPVPIFLLINKCDLPSPSVNVKSLNSLCLDYELDAWYMTSAKIDVNIGEAMFHVIKRALKVKRDADRYASLYTITEENILLHDERTHLPSGRHSRSKRCCDFK